MSAKQIETKTSNIKAQTIVFDAIDAASSALRDISLDLHKHPETAWTERHAHDILTTFLEKQGFTVTRHAFGLDTAFKAEFSRGQGRRVGFCSEYDALPGIGHACGHNLIAITGLACAMAIKALLEKGEATGTVVLFGTPAEELLAGKIIMLNKNAFQESVDTCMMLHPAPVHSNYTSMFALQDVKVEFRGQPAHAGGAPWDGVNALDAICQAWVSIGLLRQQLEATDRIHGIITDGGKAPNIIPDYTAGHFYVRASNPRRVDWLKKKAQDVFQAAAMATGCEVTMNWREIGTCKNIIQNSVMAETYAAYLKDFGGQMAPRHEQESKPAGASSDFGNVSYAMPGIHPLFAINTQAYLHTEEFASKACTEEGHQSTIDASKSLAMVGARMLLEDDFFQAAKDEYEQTVPKDLR